MKILIVSQYFWPENFRINDLATEFAARGLDPAIAGACDLTVSIPHAGRAESLNLAAAASLCLMTSAAVQAGRIVRGR